MSVPLYHHQAPFGAQMPYPQPVTSLSFDPVSDTLWAGNTAGLVHACHGASRMRGVSYFVARGDPIKKIVASESVVHACTSSSVGSWGKGGVNKWYHQPDKGAATFEHHPSKPHTLVIAQSAPEFLLLNSTTGAVLRTMSAPSVVTALKASHSALLSGAADGVLRVHDVRSPGTRSENDSSEMSVLAHVGGILAVDVGGTTAFTIGWSLRQSRPLPDPLVKLFDLRMLRPLGPMHFPTGPAFINVHPKKPSLLTITSAQGLVNIIDITKSSDGGEFHQIDVASYLSAVAISPDGSYVTFGDADGMIHTLTSTIDEERVPFNGFEGKSIEWADTPEPLPSIDWDDRTPLNRVGMPYYDKELLSYYDHPLVPASTAVAPPQKIPPQVLNSVRVQDHLQYAILPKELRGRRNVVKTIPARKAEGRFRSDLARRTDDDPGPMSPSTLESADPEVPYLYHRVGIKYSKFGVEDFDFGYYNKTSYSGLETDIPNSYANSLIQLLHYCTPIRRLGKSHITTSCRTEHCLLCEFGFVARMLEDARGINLQARNFCVTVGRKQTAQSFGVIDRSIDGENADYASMIQQLNRFILEEFSVEGNTFPHNPYLIPSGDDSRSITFAAAPITQLLGVDAKTVTICTNCGFKRVKDLMSHVVDLIYPRKPASVQDPHPTTDLDFSGILRSSLERDIMYKSTCQVCKNLANHRSRRALSSTHMPPLLAVNAAVNNEDHFRFWLDNHSSRFLSSSVPLAMRDAEGVLDPNSAEVVTYDLRGYVAEIRTGAVRHLVAIIKTARPTDEGEGSGTGSWHLFNDFVVQTIPEDEALSFPGKWKVPCVLFLERTDAVRDLNYSGLPETLDPEILSQRMSMAAQINWEATKHEILSADEIPKPGTLVSIDAEFVALQQEESEIRSDGTKKVLKPSQMSLARVSVLRGSGSKMGAPFIDDYIHTSDTIVDYLTEYSGIQPGDLHPNYSTHVLLPLKVVYKKLRLLVDLGCIFVGHGLSKDFRIITNHPDIFVPPERVMDTVDIYYIPERGRRLSLRFLTYSVFKQEIQVDTHDSIEDARAALLLHRTFQEREAEGTFDDLLREIYAEGKKLNWKVPEPTKRPTPTVISQRATFADNRSSQIHAMGYNTPPSHSGAFQPPGMTSFPGGPSLPPWSGAGR